MNFQERADGVEKNVKMAFNRGKWKKSTEGAEMKKSQVDQGTQGGGGIVLRRGEEASRNGRES